MSAGRPSAEGFIQVAIMLAIGGAAGAASFTHVHDVAAAHGQPGWLAWADAVVLELMSVASGLEMRRRRRAHAPVGFPAAVLVVAMTLSLTAQVVEAEVSAIGLDGSGNPGARLPGDGEDCVGPGSAAFDVCGASDPKIRGVERPGRRPAPGQAGHGDRSRPFAPRDSPVGSGCATSAGCAGDGSGAGAAFGAAAERCDRRGKCRS
jgi:hypothetical protein